MKNFVLLLIATVLCSFQLIADPSSTVKETTTGCTYDAWFKYPANNAHFEKGKDIYVKVDPKNYGHIAYMELYVDGQYIRKESSYPYEWARPNSPGDHYLRNLSCGKHTIKVKIKDKCGGTHYKEICVYVDCHDNGGGHNNCDWEAWYKYPQAEGHYEKGKPVYVRIDPKKYQDIAYMELYVDGKYVRKESQYPYEWCKGTDNSDSYLRNLACGKHHLKVKIVDKCGNVHYKEIYIYIDCHDNGGGHNNCDWEAWFKYPQMNGHYQRGKAVYVRVDPKKYQDIAYMELYVDGKYVRKESQYPYEWCKGTGTSDAYLRHLGCGKHTIKVKIVDKCGNVHYKEIYIYIDC